MNETDCINTQICSLLNVNALCHRVTVLYLVSVFRLLLYFVYAINFLFFMTWVYRRVAEIQIFEKTYLIVIKDETCLKFKLNDSTLFLIGSYAQKLVASY